MSSRPDKLNLRPFEKRLVVGVGVLLFFVLNAWLVWPHFKDWGETQDRLEGQRIVLKKYSDAIDEKKKFEGKVREFEAQGATVSADDQANQFLRTVQNQAAISGVSIMSISRQSTGTNAFFLEQRQTFTVQANDEQLVDFLYSLGSGDSIIRARGLSLRPNGPRQQLGGNLDLVASYQKKPGVKNAPAPAKNPAPIKSPVAPTPAKPATVKKP